MTPVDLSPSNITCSDVCDVMQEDIESNECVTTFNNRINNLNRQLFDTSNGLIIDPLLRLMLENVTNRYISRVKDLTREYITENPDEANRIQKIKKFHLAFHEHRALQDYGITYINYKTSLPNKKINNLLQDTLTMHRHITAFNRENPSNTPLSPALKQEWKALVAKQQDVIYNNQSQKNIHIITNACLQQIKTIDELDDRDIEYTITDLKAHLNKVYERNIGSQVVPILFITKKPLEQYPCLKEITQEVYEERQKDKAILESSHR